MKATNNFIAYRIVIFLVIFSQSFLCFSKQISEEQSLQIAKQFYEKNVIKDYNNLKSASMLKYNIEYICAEESDNLKSTTIENSGNGKVYYYVYNVGDNQGFVMVSGDDRTKPILGYSDQGRFENKNMPAHIKFFLNIYKEQIKEVQQNNDTTAYVPRYSVKENSSFVLPLIKTKWGQRTPYNCAILEYGKKNDSYPAGCNATAMAQVMNFHKWPEHGYNSNGYDQDIYGKIPFFADFENSYYDWENMKDEYSFNDDTTSVSCRAVSKLMYHCGVSLFSKYSENNTTALSVHIAAALKAFFGYDEGVKWVPHNNMNDEEWKNIIIGEIDSRRPVIIGGQLQDTDAGHTYVLDGYDSNKMIHVNWGWDGAMDGYFEINSIASTPNNTLFSRIMDLTIGIKKPDKIGSLYYDNSGFYFTSKNKCPLNKEIPIVGSYYVKEVNGDSFSGKVGIALYEDNNLVAVVDSNSIKIDKVVNNLPKNFGKEFSVKLKKNIPNGTYKIDLVYKSDSDSAWIPVFLSKSPYNYEIEVIDGWYTLYYNSITVKCNGAGDLVTKVSTPHQLDRLVVKGSISNFDINYIRNKLGKTTLVDLKDVDIIKTYGMFLNDEQEIYTTGFAKTFIRELILPLNLRKIEHRAFMLSNSLIDITIPPLVKYITEFDFVECSRLQRVNLPDSLKAIGKGAFLSCDKLKSIELPSTLESIDSFAFSNCYSLSEIKSYNVNPPVLADTVVFHGMSNDIPVHVPKGCKNLYKSAKGWNEFTNIIDDLPVKIIKTVDNKFAGKLSKNFTQGEKVTITNLTVKGFLNAVDFAFLRDSMPQITMLDISEVKLSENKIPDKAFYNENKKSNILLEKVLFPKLTVAIGDSAFKDCTHLSDVCLPAYLNNIGLCAFDGCINISEFKIKNGGSNYYIIDGNVYNTILTSLVLYAPGKKDKIIEIDKPNICSSAFCGCPFLEEVKFNKNVVLIGDWAFNNCIALKTIRFDSGIVAIGDGAFNNCSQIMSIFSDCKIPPIIGGKFAFNKVPKGIPVSVPSETVSKYKNSIGWSDFTNYSNESFTKTVLNNIGGKLSTHFTEEEKIVTKKLIITGELEYKDFQFMRSLSSLSELDILGTKITDLSKYLNSFYNLNVLILPANLKLVGDEEFRFNRNLSKVIIPSSVTSIGELAFSDCVNLTSLNIPESVISIGKSAFYNCCKLDSIIIPSLVNSIKERTFYGCKELNYLKLSESILSIGINAFEGCEKLTYLNIPDNVKAIEVGAFSYCKNLSSIKIPEGITSIKERSFIGCSMLSSVFIPNSVTQIEKNAFESCNSIKKIIIPNSVNYIGDYAFKYCDKLDSVILPNSLKRINIGTFVLCSNLHQILIPGSVISIGDNAFFSCRSLEKIEIPNSVTSIGISAFEFCSKLSSINIPASVNVISEKVFGGCYSLKSFTIPMSVNSIGNNAFMGSGLNVLKAANPSPIDLSQSTNVFNGIDKNNCILIVPSGFKSAYQNANKWKEFKYIIDNEYPTEKTITVSAGKLSSQFTSLETHTLTDLTLKGTIDSRDFVFIRDSLTVLAKLDISEVQIVSYSGANGTGGSLIKDYEANSIPHFAFYNPVNYLGKNSLTEIVLPKSLVNIDYYSFGECTNLNSLIIPNSLKSIKNYAFCNCINLKSLILPSSVSKIGSFVFNGCSGLENVDLPSSLDSIAPYTFQNCKSLYSLNIPASIKHIDYTSFNNCPAIITVDLNNKKYSSIDGVLFDKSRETLYHCPFVLKGEYSVPITVEKIDSNAFLGCTNIISLIIPPSVKFIGNYAFKNCKKLKSISLPSSLEHIGKGLFYNCESLCSVILPSTITSIGENSFNNCIELTSVNIPISVKTIASGAFYNCNKLIDIYTNSYIPIDLSMSKSVFQGIDILKCILHVPNGSASNYQNSFQWGDFLNIVENKVFELSEELIIIKSGGGEKSINLYTNTLWEILNDDSWLTISPASGYGNSKLSISVNPNIDDKRTANIILKTVFSGSKIISLSQDAGNLALSVLNNNLIINRENNTQIEILSNTNWNIVSDQLWLSINPKEGFGNCNIILSAIENPSSNARIANVTISGEGVEPVSVKVSQEPTPALTVSTNTITLNKEENSSNTIIVSSNISWTAVSNEPWLTLNPMNGINNGIITLTATKNSSTEERSAIVTISGLNVDKQSVIVTQEPGVSSNYSPELELIMLFPNPVDDILKITGIKAESDIMIYDLNGKVILERKISKDEIIPTNSWKKGTYLVKIISEDFIEEKKIIIK
jgi:hypothetical protein